MPSLRARFERGGKMKLFRRLTWKDSKPLLWFGLGTIAFILLDLGSKWLVERLVPLTAGPGIEVIPNFQNH